MITKEGERKKGCNMSLSGTYQHFAETQTPERQKSIWIPAQCAGLHALAAYQNQQYLMTKEASWCWKVSHWAQYSQGLNGHKKSPEWSHSHKRQLESSRCLLWTFIWTNISKTNQNVFSFSNTVSLPKPISQTKMGERAEVKMDWKEAHRKKTNKENNRRDG